MEKINSILEEVLKNIEPSEEDKNFIKDFLKDFMKSLKNLVKNKKINVDIFIGGSFAKGTLIKKDKYDIDLFLRFDKKYKNSEISQIANKILKEMKLKEFSVIHGSRDYFNIKVKDNFFIEVVPVKKINNPKEAENITDLSYSHVKYMSKKVKSKKILDGIKLAKAFCYACNCYGAESYINGFSGYSLELLVYHYGGFLKFIKEMSKINPEGKVVIDPEKSYKNKKEVLLDMNTSKLVSPIILVDPTYKQRNALAALSKETFLKFQNHCKDFVKSPSIKHFEIKKTDINKIKENAIKNKKEFILIDINTEKQEGDVAGSKLFKFYNHLTKEIEKAFTISKKGFNYNQKKGARCFFVAKRKDFVLSIGPFVKDKKNVSKFKKEHKGIFEKNKRLYAKEKSNLSLKEFIKKWKVKNKRKIIDMSIKEIKLN